MNKFIVIYHASGEALEEAKKTPSEEAKKEMELWYQWAKECGKHLVDFGTPLGFGKKLLTNGNIVSSKREVCGYSILQANDMDHAKSLLKNHPHLSGWSASCEIEVHETLPMPG